MTHFVKALDSGIGLILRLQHCRAQKRCHGSTGCGTGCKPADESCGCSAAAETSASGLDPALYTRNEPTRGIGMPVGWRASIFQQQFSPNGETRTVDSTTRVLIR